MAEYIDRDQLIDWLKTEIKFKDLSDGLGICLVIMKEDFERAIKHMPDSIIKDVAPVRHGRWITKKAATGKEYTICSACDFAVYYTMAGVLTPLDIRNAKYCPNCGAEMNMEE